MIKEQENGPFSQNQRLSILQNLKKKTELPKDTKLKYVEDIHSKFESEAEKELKDKFMVFQWFNKLKFSGSKIPLPCFSFEEMTENGFLNTGLVARLKSMSSL